MAERRGIVDLEEGLTADEQARSLACAAEIERVLHRYGCRIVTAPIVTGDVLFSEVHVLPAQPRRPDVAVPVAKEIPR